MMRHEYRKLFRRATLDRRVAVILSVLLLALSGVAAQAQLSFLGDEQRIDTDGSQSRPRQPSSARASDGSWVVLRGEELGDIRGQRLDARGRFVGDDILMVRTNPRAVPFRGEVSVHRHPVGAFLEDGSLLVLWTEQRVRLNLSVLFARETVLSQNIMAQRFDGDLRPLGDRYTVGRRQGTEGDFPRLAPLANGSWVVVWRAPNRGIYANLLDDEGRTRRSPFLVASDDRPGRPQVAAAADGGFLVAYSGCCDSQSGSDLFARIYNNRGRPEGSTFIVNGTRAGQQGSAAVSALRDDAYLVAWTGETGEIVGGRRETRIFAQVVSSEGAFEGGEVELTSGEAWGHDEPQLVALQHGQALVYRTWEGSFPSSIRGLVLNGSGEPEAESFVIAHRSVLGDAQVLASGSDLLVTWVRAHDDGFGVSARFLTQDTVAQVCGRSDVLATSSPLFSSACAPSPCSSSAASAAAAAFGRVVGVASVSCTD